MVCVYNYVCMCFQALTVSPAEMAELIKMLCLQFLSSAWLCAHHKFHISNQNSRSGLSCWLVSRCSPINMAATRPAEWPHVTKPTRSTQPCIPLGLLNRVPALIGWGNGGNLTSAGWQVTLCDPIWHVSSRSGAVLVAQAAIRFLPSFLLPADN